MPQFLDAGASASVRDTLMLSVIALAGTVVWSLLVADVVSTLRKLFARPLVRRILDGLTGTALIALGLRLATSTRP